MSVVNEKWYNKSVERTLSLLETDSDTGLTQEEVAERLKNDGENEIYPIPQTSFKKYIKHLLTDYTTILMIVTIIIASVFQDTPALKVMLVTVAIYYAVAVATLIHSKKTIENVCTTVLPNIRVLRGGRRYMVRQKKIVRGDIIFVSKGDIVPCDARIIEADSLEVLETNVTSKPEFSLKDGTFIDYRDISPAEQKNMLFASSVVVNGSAKCVCCVTGGDTLVCKMKKNNVRYTSGHMAAFDRTAKFCSMWTLLMTFAIIVITLIDMFISGSDGHGIYDSFMLGLAVCVSSMSEFYTAFAYIILSCGIFNAYDRKKDINRGALIKNISKTEKLRKLTCLVVPESAFHCGGMQIEKLYSDSNVYTVSDGRRGSESRVLRYALISTGMYGSEYFRLRSRRELDCMSDENAIISACEKYGEYGIDLENRYRMIQHLSVSEDNKFETTLVLYEYRCIVALRGDYREVLSRCRYYTENSRLCEMTQEKTVELISEAEKLSREQYKVVAVATKDTIYNDLEKLFLCQTEMTFEGFIAMREPTLPEAAKNVSRCLGAGIKVIMTSPDNDERSVMFAESVGVLGKGRISLSGEDINRMNEPVFRANTGICTLYKGVSPEFDRYLVGCLHEDGETVGYLCTTLDRILPMKESDVGFAESITLSDNAMKNGIDIEGRRTLSVNGADSSSEGEAIKFISDTVVSIPDKDGTGGFNAVVDSILCAKSVYHNLSSMVKYMITSQLAKLIIVFLSVITGTDFLTPVQITVIGLIFDFIALMVIAFERPRYEILNVNDSVTERLGRPVRENIFCIVYGAVWAVLSVIMAVILKKVGSITSEQVPGCIFLCFIVSQTAALIENKRLNGTFRRYIRISGAFSFMLVFTALFIVLTVLCRPFGALFDVYGTGRIGWIGLLSVPAITLLSCEIYGFIRKTEKNRKRKK